MSVAPLHPAHPPPLSAAEALSSLLWQPYDCRSAASPPLSVSARIARSFTDDFLAARGRGEPPLQPPPPPPAPCARAPRVPLSRQSPIGGRHARMRLERPRPRDNIHRSESEMRLAVPAPAPAAARKCAVTVRVPGETSACANVSSVHIVPELDDSADGNGSAERERTFASAECQTEEPSRRRRQRRVRAGAPAAAGLRVQCGQVVPDLLDAHVPPPPPPYSTLPPAAPAALMAGPPPAALVAAPPTHRFPFQPIPLRRSGRSAAYACSESGGAAPKSCCGLGGARPPLRWCVLLVGVAGVCCVAAGAVLGALRPHPRPHLTLLLLMIGVGVVLVSVAGLAWRLSARDAPPCRALLGLRRGASCGRRLVPRLPPSYARPHHPYAAMLYPEFHYRPPPPSYQASMQEYRLRLLLLDRSAPALSPPPTYRSNAASLVRGSGLGVGWCGSEYSGPPSYRGAPRTTVVTPPSEPPASLAGVVLDNIGVDSFSIKYSDDNHIVLPTNNTKQEEKDDNLVTIVQTGEDIQPVIVTVSGSTAVAESEHVHTTSEIDILAHL